jgi:hypothetical protein
MPCDCGPPPTHEEMIERENEEKRIIEKRVREYPILYNECMKLRGLIKLYQDFIPDEMIENSFYLHHIEMEKELEELRRIVGIAKSGVDITLYDIPIVTKEWKRENETTII